MFDGLGAAVTILRLDNNALGAGSLGDGVFEPLTGLSTLALRLNPGSASFLPKADAGADLVLRAGESATLGGPGTGGGPWGMNVEYGWVEIDADDNPVAEAERTEDLSAANVASPVFTAPALTEERVLRYRFTVQGLGHGNTNAYTATDTITVTVRAAPAVTAVALTSVPQAGATYRSGETIEVSVTFSAPVTVTGTPTIGLEVGTVVRQAAYARNAGPAVLLFSYAVTDADTDDDGVAVPADGILLAGGTIAGAHGVALLAHDGVAADAAHMVDGSDAALTGGVCDRTPQVRDALVAAAKANRAAATDCSLVTTGVTGDLDGITGTLQLAGRGIAALKGDDFEDLDNLTGLDLSGNALSALPAAVFDPLTSLTALHLNSNALAEGGLPDGVFAALDMLTTLDLRQNPGSASFVPRADAGLDLDVRAREVATLDGSGTHGGPWGTNVTYEWVEVDAQGNEVAASARTEGLSATNVASPDFTAPVLTEERVLHYRLTVTGQGAATRGAVNRHSASATVQVTVRGRPGADRGGGDAAAAAAGALRHRRDDRGDGKFRGGGEGDRRRSGAGARPRRGQAGGDLPAGQKRPDQARVRLHGARGRPGSRHRVFRRTRSRSRPAAKSARWRHRWRWGSGWRRPRRSTGWTGCARRWTGWSCRRCSAWR